MLKKLNLLWISSLAVLIFFSTYHMISLSSRAMGACSFDFWEGMWWILCFLPITLFYLFPYPCLLAYFLWKRHSFSIPQRILSCLLYLGVSLVLFHLPFAWELWEACRTGNFWWEAYSCLLIGILLSTALFAIAMLVSWFHPQPVPQPEEAVGSLRYVFLYFLAVALGLSLLYLDGSEDHQLIWLLFLLPSALLSLYIAGPLLGWAWERKRRSSVGDYLTALPLIFLLSMLVFGLGVFSVADLTLPMPQPSFGRPDFIVLFTLRQLLQSLELDLFFSLWFTLLFLAGGLITKLILWARRNGAPDKKAQ